MKAFVFCVALLASSCITLARDITTLTGVTYFDSVITKVEKTGIDITYREGMTFLDFSILPIDLVKQLTQLEADGDSIPPTPELSHASEITTLDGNTYRDVTVTEIQRTGIRVTHRNGIGIIDYLTLPTQVRKKYGYTETRYAAGLAIRHQREYAASEIHRRVAASITTQSEDRRRKEDPSIPTFAPRPTSPSNQSPEATAESADALSSSIATRDYSTRGYDADRFSGGTVHVNGYFRKNGTYVHSYTRRK